MSPRTTTHSHPSSVISKEVPRAAILFSDNPPSTSDFEAHGLTDDELVEIKSIKMTKNASKESNSIKDDQNLRNLVEDSIQGLTALAASAAAASLPIERVSSPPEEEDIIFETLNEDEILGKLFTCGLEEETVSQIYKVYCNEEYVSEAKDKLNAIISKSDALLQSKSISMSLGDIFPLFLQRIIEQESSRTGKSDFTTFLMDDQFISSSATVILMLPRLISILFRVEEVASALSSNLFDILIAIEQVLKAMPELMKLPETQRRLQQLQQFLLEDAVWRVGEGSEGSIIYELLRKEMKSVNVVVDCPSNIVSTLSGIRSSQRALETLTGFPVSGMPLTRLELFFRKYLRLAAQRLQYATIRLGLSPFVTQLAWEFFFDLVKREGHQTFFKNRHLNQILLATIYCSSNLVEEERTFQQICQVLPSVQIKTTWLFTSDGRRPCDFYTFYNEIFVPSLKKRIESFLNHQQTRQQKDSLEPRWILDGLFTSAPFPSTPQYQLSTNVTLNRLNQPKSESRATSTSTRTRYEWINPLEYCTNNSNNNVNSNNCDPFKLAAKIKTPSNTSQLFNFNTAAATTEDSDTRKRPHQSQSPNDLRLKRIARKLDFTSEPEEL